MRIPVFAIATILLFTMLAAAQDRPDHPQTEIFGGYSLERVAPCGESGGGCNFESAEGPVTASFNGWNASVARFFSKSWGAAADFSGHYGSASYNLGGTASYSNYSYMFGPVYAIRMATATPFVHGLIGGVSWRSPSNLGQYNALAWAAGGGVDVNATPRVAVRVVQFDYLGTRAPHNNNSLIGTGWRFSIGFVFKF